jgi:hypothetical protein
MKLEPFDPEQIRILRSMTPSQRFELGIRVNRCALDRYRQKLIRELPEWTEAERARLLRSAVSCGMIDANPDWFEIYNSADFQAWLAESKTAG